MLIQDAQVIVKDTGTGIDPEILPRLFSKFASKSYQCTGLELFICKVLLKLMEVRYGLKIIIIIILILIEKKEIHFPLLCQPSIDNKM